MEVPKNPDSLSNIKSQSLHLLQYSFRLQYLISSSTQSLSKSNRSFNRKLQSLYKLLRSLPQFCSSHHPELDYLFEVPSSEGKEWEWEQATTIDEDEPMEIGLNWKKRDKKMIELEKWVKEKDEGLVRLIEVQEDWEQICAMVRDKAKDKKGEDNKDKDGNKEDESKDKDDKTVNGNDEKIDKVEEKREQSKEQNKEQRKEQKPDHNKEQSNEKRRSKEREDNKIENENRKSKDLNKKCLEKDKRKSKEKEEKRPEVDRRKSKENDGKEHEKNKRESLEYKEKDRENVDKLCENKRKSKDKVFENNLNYKEKKRNKEMNEKDDDKIKLDFRKRKAEDECNNIFVATKCSPFKNKKAKIDDEEIRMVKNKEINTINLIKQQNITKGSNLEQYEKITPSKELIYDTENPCDILQETSIRLTEEHLVNKEPTKQHHQSRQARHFDVNRPNTHHPPINYPQYYPQSTPPFPPIPPQIPHHSFYPHPPSYPIPFPSYPYSSYYPPHYPSYPLPPTHYSPYLDHASNTLDSSLSHRPPPKR